VIRQLGKTRNWWADSWGFQYIVTWRKAEKTYKEYVGIGAEESFERIASLEESDVLEAIKLFEAVRVGAKKTGYDAKRWAEWMYLIAKERQKGGAIKQWKMFLEKYWLLSWDVNYNSQAFFRTFMERPDDDLELVAAVVSLEETIQKLEEAKKEWEDPKPIPDYYLDGVHTVGKDRRFAGIGMYMAGCCLAYEKYGRLSPDDKWTQDIWEAIR